LKCFVGLLCGGLSGSLLRLRHESREQSRAQACDGERSEFFSLYSSVHSRFLNSVSFGFAVRFATPIYGQVVAGDS
jgi:hypothetical protein